MGKIYYGSTLIVGGAGGSGANKIKYNPAPGKIGTVIDPNGILSTLYIDADVNIDNAVNTIFSLTGEEDSYASFVSENEDFFMEFCPLTSDGNIIMLIIGDDENCSMYLFSKITTSDYGATINRGVSLLLNMSTMENQLLSGIVTKNYSNIQGSDFEGSVGSQNSLLTSIFSFNSPFVTSTGSEGFALYNGSTIIEGQTDNVKLKTVNGNSLIGTGNIEIQGGVTSVGGATGAIDLGAGLSMSSNTLSVTSAGITWGSITGTLSNQTDLNTALTAKLDASKCTYQTTEPTSAISDGGIHIVYLTTDPATRYDGYIYLIKE